MEPKHYKLAIVVSIVLLLGSYGRWPYGYYTLLRISVATTALFLWGFYSERHQEGWKNFYLGVAILFNPIIPFSLGRPIWSVLDLAVIVPLLISWGDLKAPGRAIATNISTNLNHWPDSVSKHLYETRLKAFEDEACELDDGEPSFIPNEASLKAMLQYVSEARRLLDLVHQDEWKDPNMKLLWEGMESRFVNDLPDPFGKWVGELYNCIARNHDLTPADIDEVKLCKQGHILFVADNYTFNEELECEECSQPQHSWKIEYEE